jgi:alpha-beta hydrolase superfamily lysophospholipase
VIAPVAERFAFSERAAPFAAGGVHGYAWRHPAPAASLVLLHGLQSHAQWFAEAGDLLLDRGLSVYALDRRGSGSSPGERGDVARYGDWLDEVEAAVALAGEAGAPVHLAGHCFGANVALTTVLERRPPVASVVLLAPGLHLLPDYSPAQKLRIVASRDRARFRVPQDDDLFSRDPEVVAWIAADALGSKLVTRRCLLEANRMHRRLRRRAGEVDLPVLVLAASRDRISDNARNRALLEPALGDRLRWVDFDAEHFLLAEPCRDDVVDELAAWAAA